MGSWRSIPERCFWRNLMATSHFDDSFAYLNDLRLQVQEKFGWQDPVACMCEAVQSFKSTEADCIRACDVAIGVAVSYLNPKEHPHILVEIRNVYGNETIYPACDKAQAFCQIAGTRTLPRHLIKHINALGFEVRLAPQITVLISDAKVSG